MRVPTVFLAALAALFVVQPASAHVTTSPTEVQAGYTYTEFSVPHGCDGSATTKLTVRIPTGIASVKPQEVAGWTIATKEGTLPEPVSIFGEETTEGVTEVSWTGGPLADSHLQLFGLSFFASDTLAGETVYFPTVQRCKEGVHRWIAIPVEGEEEPEEPAPGVAVLASAEEEGGGGGAATTTEEQATGNEQQAAPQPTAAQTDEDGGSKATIALILGIAGLVAGLAALVVTLWRPRRA
jgi:periplasmic copper chaperone A